MTTTQDPAAASLTGLEIAIIGMAGRFSAADNIDALWQLLNEGREALRDVTDAELDMAGVPGDVRNHADYVRKRGVLNRKREFDAGLFGYSAGDAATMDPQFAVFHELAWEALENAGYDSTRYDGLIGVYAGATPSDSWLARVMSEQSTLAGQYSVASLSKAGYLSTRVAHRLDLTGPALTINTTCSTSLVGIHTACQALLTGDCDMALAGGVSVSIDSQGYLYQPNMVMSPDGSCRPFDAAGNGTASGEGGGVLVLKRLQDAMADNDTVLAVIKGTAINNDGQRKVGFAAPSVEGQARAIRTALERAEVAAGSIGYIEAHGTATSMGDPIELAALRQVFGDKPPASCPIGSVKSTIGHLSEGAGVAGVIKTVLALQHGVIPPNPYFAAPNPLLKMESSPFFVNREALPWPRASNDRRRAGVSSFGIGGTNAHAVLEESGFSPRSGPARAQQIVSLSAQTRSALQSMQLRLSAYAAAHPEANLADICHTLHVGRRELPYRAAFVAADMQELVQRLQEDGQRGAASSGKVGKVAPGLCFMFPGQGAQYAGMGRALYDTEQVFRRTLDECFALSARLGAADLHALYVSGDADALHDTAVVQPMLFCVEYALATLLQHWGARPQAYLGHSIGEYVGACLAGVFSLRDAIALVIARGRIMQQLPPGGMLAVSLSAQELQPLLNSSGAMLDIAALNSPMRTVVAGDLASINALREQLAARQVDSTLLATSHAFHSRHLDALMQRFEQAFDGMLLQAPRVPLLSNLSGGWLRDDEATSPAYWAAQMRGTVRFADCVRQLCRDKEQVLLEVGPGASLSSFAMQCTDTAFGKRCVSLMPSASRHTQQNGVRLLLEGVCQLFISGVQLDWQAFYEGQQRRRLPLPSYPFEGTCHYPAELLFRSADRFPAAPLSAADVAPVAAPQAEPADAIDSMSNGVTVDIDGSVEDKLLAVWRRYLGQPELMADEDLFDFGVDSLMSIRVITEIRETFHVDLPLDAIFTLRTVSAQAREIERFAGADAEGASLVVTAWEHGGSGPLSPAQKRMWIISQLEQGNSAYNVGFHHFMQGLDLGVLQRVFRAVIMRHSILRTRYVEVNGEPVQQIRPDFDFHVDVTDISQLPEQERHRECERRWQAALLRPISLANDLMLRVEVLKLDQNTHLLMVTQHHICSDNWSLNLLIDEVNRLYEAYAAGRPDPLDALPVQYIDYALSQDKWLAGGVLERQLPFWSETLAGIPAVHALPLDFERPKYQSFRGTRHVSKVGSAVLDSLNQLGLQHGATLFMTLQAAYAAFLSRYSGESDIVVGFPIANRSQRELESLIGFFVNTLVLRTDLSERPNFVQLLEQTRGNLLAAYAHQDVPFETLVERLKPVRSLSYEPIVQLMLVYLDQSQGVGGRGAAYDQAATQFEQQKMKLPYSKYDLTLYFSVVDGGLELAWEYAADLFRPETIERMAHNFEAFLKSIVAAPEQPICTLPLLAPAEERRLLDYGNVPASSLYAQAPLPSGAADSFNFSLFYFASDNGARAADKYDLLMKGARFADEHGFEAVWTPERHFDAFGGVYPNPAITAAVLAGVTSRVHIRAGSCVLPLHNPVRVAEDWSVVDNVSGGRIGIGFAAGYAARDFTLAPEHFGTRRDVLVQGVQLVKALWRGDSVVMPDGKGEAHEVRIRPRPIQPELPVWVTTIGNEAAFRDAGRKGDNILTHLMGQTLEELTLKIAVYREERRAAGHPGEGKVSLLVHTFIAEREDMVVTHVKNPFKKYLIDSVGTPQQIQATLDTSGVAGVDQTDVEAITEHAFVRYRRSKALFGTPEQCLPLVQAIRAAGVNEVACLIDFGVESSLVLDALPRLRQLREMALAQPEPADNPADEPLAEAAQSVHGRFERQVEQDPGAVAIVEGDRQWTYAELNARANGLARLLLNEYKVGPERRIGLCMARGADLITAMLAVLKAGAAWVPVLPDDRPAQVAARLAEADAVLVLTRRADSAACLAAWDGPQVQIDGLVSPAGDANPALVVDAHQAACVLYSEDGSGLLAEHGNLVALWSALAATALRDCPPRSRVAFAAPLPTHAALRTFLQLLSGHTLVVTPEPADAAGLAHSLAAQRIDVFDSTAESLPALLAAGAVARVVIARPGPDELPMCSRLEELGINVQRLYGASECGAGAVLDGRPLPHARVYLLDGDGQPVPLGVPGEIHVGGAGVVRGPVDASRRGAQRFRADPYEGKEGARLVRTGDLGCWLPDGTLAYLGRNLQPQLRYWATQLAGMPALLNLQTDRVRPATPSGRTGGYDFIVPSTLADRLAGAAAHHGMEDVLLAGFAVLLHRYSGQDDICVDIRAGRDQAVLRARIDSAAPFAKLQEQVQEAVTQAWVHGEPGYSAVQEALREALRRDQGSHAPLCQAMFTWCEGPAVLEGQVARHDLTCAMECQGGQLRGTLYFSSDLFDASTAERMVQHYLVLLEGLVAAPEVAVRDVPMLMESELEQVVEAWNATAVPVSPVAALHQLFEAQAARHPGAVALTCGRLQLTYAELNTRANRLAHALRALGVGPDVVVGICMERDTDIVVAMLGVLKAGGAYVPLDPAYPAARLEFMLADAQPAVVLTQQRIEPNLSSYTGPRLCLDRDWDSSIATYPALDPAPLAGPDHLAYVIYTSGSTGQPKGVMIEHRNVLNFVDWSLRQFDAQALACTAFSTSINFDLAVFELYVPLSTGATVRLLPNVLGVAVDSEVTLLNTVPSAMAALFDAGQVPSGLRTLNLAGEPLTQALSERVFTQTSLNCIHNLYGPTETTTYSTHARVERDQPFRSLVGRPIANTQVYILDTVGRPQPVGVAGEIYIGGAGVARGYLNRPELTAERFVENRFPGGGGRMYRTGDLGVYLPDGNIKYLGRMDHQVKLRGFRIELGEIEAALLQEATVAQAAVSLREDGGDLRIVAYVVTKSGPSALDALRANLATKLPEHMLPSAFVVLDRLPLTPNGKIDRGALPAPTAERRSGAPFVAPRNQTEAMLSDLIGDLLRAGPVGVDDNFFDLGGHSLMAVQLLGRIRTAIGIDLPLRNIFEASSVARLAEVIDLLRAVSAVPAHQDGLEVIEF